MTMLAYPLAWPLVCLALIGIGATARRLGGHADRSLDHLPRDGWVGWGIVLIFLQLWHLFRPVGHLALGVVLVVGIGLLIRNRPRLYGWALPVLCLPALWLVSGWTLRSLAIDTGLYHLAAIRWAREFAIVPGLGLLHDRLAFNNSSFLWLACCEHWPWGMPRAAAGVEILLYLSVVNALLGMRRVATAMVPRPRDIFDALSLVPLGVVIMQDHRYDGPLSPDLLLFPLGLMVVSELLGLLDSPAEGRAVAVLLLSACAVTVKLSYAGAALAVWALVLILHRTRPRIWAWALAVAAGTGGLWSLRSVLLSGWPAYPLSVGGVSVAWRIPAAEVSATRELIQSWARAPGGADIAFLDGMQALAIQRFAVMTPLLLLAVAVGVGLYRRRGGRTWLALIPVVAGLGFWLVTAPLPRFASSLPWAAALAAISCAFPGLPAARVRAATLGFTLVLAVGLIDPWAYANQVRNGVAAIPEVQLDLRLTDSGLAILVPVEGRQCWDAPLPHAPVLDSRLTLREPYRLQSGFQRLPEE